VFAPQHFGSRGLAICDRLHDPQMLIDRNAEKVPGLRGEILAPDERARRAEGELRNMFRRALEHAAIGEMQDFGMELAVQFHILLQTLER